MSGERGLEIVFEPRVGRRIFERTADGREFEWGEITAWEPPARLGYRWSIATTPEDATDVEIRFHRDGESATRVEIEHRGWDRLGARGPSWRDVNQGGWDGTLPAFQRACRRRSASTSGQWGVVARRGGRKMIGRRRHR